MDVRFCAANTNTRKPVLAQCPNAVQSPVGLDSHRPSLAFFLARVAVPIPHFISFEVVILIEMVGRVRPVATVWRGAAIAMLNIEMVIYVALEMCRPMKPRAGANEDATGKPFRTVVAVGSTRIRGVVVIAIGTTRRNPDADIDSSLCFGSGDREANCSSNR